MAPHAPLIASSVVDAQLFAETVAAIVGAVATVVFTRVSDRKDPPSNSATVIGSGAATVVNQSTRKTKIAINVTFGGSEKRRSTPQRSSFWEELEWWEQLLLVFGAAFAIFAAAAWMRIEFDGWLRPLLAFFAGSCGAATATVCVAGIRDSASGGIMKWVTAFLFSLCALAPFACLVFLSHPAFGQVVGDYALELLKVNRHEGIIHLGSEAMAFLAGQVFGVFLAVAISIAALGFALLTDWGEVRFTQAVGAAVLVFAAGASVWLVAGGPSDTPTEPLVKAAGDAGRRQLTAVAVVSEAGEVTLKWKTPKRSGSVKRTIRAGRLPATVDIRSEECAAGCSVRATIKTDTASATDTANFR